MKTLIVDTSGDDCAQIAACLPADVKAGSFATSRMLPAIYFNQVERPPIIVMDIALENGIDLLRVLRHINSEAKIFVFSSLALFERRCLSEGADGFFLKYHDAAALHATVNGFCHDFAGAGACQ